MSEIKFPPAFTTRMQPTLQNEWDAFTQAHSQPSPVSIRLNPRKPVSIEGTPVPWAAQGLYLPTRPVFTLDPLFHGGTYYVQEASSMFLEQAFRQCIDTTQSLNVLDLCAAPGGKSTHILSLINSDSLLVSNEVIRSRASILAENIQKWGTSNTVVTSNDPEHFQKLPGFFDVIVVDAPCSGEGLFRKEPEAMNEWSIENTNLCSKRQRRIFEDIWPSLKEGGILIYSTCTYNPQENEENLAWLNQQHAAEFLTIKTENSWGIRTIIQQNVTGYQFYPHKAKGEGFFLAIVRKGEEAEKVSSKKHNSVFSAPSKKIAEQLRDWIKEASEQKIVQRKEFLQFFPASKSEEIELLSQKLYVLAAGTLAAIAKQDKLVPEHSMALSTEINARHFYTLSLTEDEAIRYLRKDVLDIIPEEKKGFSLVTCHGLPIGWANILDNRINNMYPAAWRIRMSK